MELSSYQLELAQPELDIAVFLNLYPQHLSRHGTMENYRNTKCKILDHAKIRIVNFDLMQDIKLKFKNLQTISTETHLADYAIIQNQIYENGSQVNTVKSDISNISLIGAYAVCRNLGISSDMILEGVKTFPTLHHRCEVVSNTQGKLIINDSKSTNLLNSIYCLNKFKNCKLIALILGGKFTDQNLQVLDGCMVDLICTFGEAGPILAKYLEQRSIKAVYCNTLEDALTRCNEHQTIIFSPGYSSLDAYKNFEERGNKFKETVAKLYSTARS
jgi:UDP-N-acetylmuramoylalanine--D-glutamate ligase